MTRRFRHVYTTRYDESDYAGNLTPTAFLRYMQDIAALDVEDTDLSGDGYWVARRTFVTFKQPVQVHTPLELTTYGLSFTRITALRAYDARVAGNDSGEPVIQARTQWVYLDARGRPTRLPERTAEIWAPDEPQPRSHEEPWPEFPHRPPYSVEFTVHFSDTDLMNHMNNAAYVEALDDAAWEVFRQAGITPDTATMRPLDYEIEYVQSARFGEMLAIESWFEPFPSPGEECVRLQHIKRGDLTLVRARSRWRWNT